MSGSDAGLRERLRDALNVDGAFLRRLAYRGTTGLPEWARRRAPSLFGTLFYGLLRDRREAVQQCQAVLRGLDPDSLAARRAALEVFTQYAHCLTDGLEMAGPSPPPVSIAVEHSELLEGPLDKHPMGVVLLTSHTGSWEVAGRGLLGKAERAMTMVMAEESDPAALRYADELRRRWGMDIVYARGSDPSTALTLLSRLRAGNLVAIQLDRPPAAAGAISVDVCGRAFAVPAGPFRLAQASGAPLVTAFTRRSGYRSYAVHLGEPLYVARRAPPEELLAVAQQAADKLGAFLQAWPDQWFHFGPWPTPTKVVIEPAATSRGLLA